MKVPALFLLACLLGRPLFAESFEGVIGTFPVWVDLKLPEKTGPVSGSYFYKKAGISIRLQGERDSLGLALKEFDRKGNVAGVFECWMAGDSLGGLWSGKRKPVQYRVALSRTDPNYKKNAGYKYGELMTANETTLEEEIKSCSGEGFTSEPETFVLYDRKNILSVGIGWSSMGAYPDEGVDYHLFDLRTKREISIWSEFDAPGKRKLYQVLVPRVEEFLKRMRTAYPDSEWMEALPGGGPEGVARDTARVLDTFFSLRDTAESVDGRLTVCYLTADSVFLDTPGHGYFGFPHVIQAMDASLGIAFSFAEFDGFLKPSSVLKNLAKSP